ncbi:hypothetical protein CWB41_13410 [Methylovirgula ligni]|nr:hypothetical protein CWB41_13410 [Methylovirgula ligni]
MIMGSVKRFDDDRDYNFSTPDDGGNDAFLHISARSESGRCRRAE